MWTILKFNKKNLLSLKKDISNKLGKDVLFYSPKIQIKKLNSKTTVINEKLLLGDYLFCFHKNFSEKSIINSLKFCKGLKYFLSNFFCSQGEIENFIKKCKEHEDTSGYINPSFFDLINNKKYEFLSGPFTNMIFDIIDQNKKSIKTFIGDYEITVSKKNNLVIPV